MAGLRPVLITSEGTTLNIWGPASACGSGQSTSDYPTNWEK